MGEKKNKYYCPKMQSETKCINKLTSKHIFAKLVDQ